jgi:spore germination protein GerM
VAVIVVLAAAAIAFTRLHPRQPIASRGPVHPGESRRRGPAHSQSARPAHTITARIYFARLLDDQERLVGIPRRVRAEAPARAALEELLSGELPRGCVRPLPRGAALRGVQVRDGVAAADFSRELISNFAGGSDNEGVTVYAIVNTLASLPGIKRVQILVEGQPTDTIGGHLDVSGPLGPDSELVVR